MYWERVWEFFSFQYEFMAYALGASVVVGVVCGLVGTFLVLRGLSLVGDAIGHSTLPGVAVAFLIVGHQSPLALLLGALGSAVLAAFTVGIFSRGSRVRSDAAIGIVLSVYFGIGIVLLAYIQSSPTGAQAGLSQFLFGNAAAITREQFFGLLGVGAVLVGAVLLFLRPLILVVFDEGFARSLGMKTSLVEIGLLGALSIAVVISIQAVGAILVAAMLIIPPSAGRLLSGDIRWVMVASVSIGAVSGALGAMFSYVFEGVATGPAMVLVATGFFLVALLFGAQGGLLSEFRTRSRAKRVRRAGEVL